MIIKYRTHFDAAHALPNYVGDCSRLHGHTWKIEVGLEFSGLPDNTTGMYIDFKTIKQDVKVVLHDFDHTLLNIQVPNPTAENLVLVLRDRLGEMFPEHFKYIEVWESEDCGVRWE
jgi:6-pyruvoyltetrahydropterin/6-carboxytetrahydropterin synthase